MRARTFSRECRVLAASFRFLFKAEGSRDGAQPTLKSDVLRSGAISDARAVPSKQAFRSSAVGDVQTMEQQRCLHGTKSLLPGRKAITTVKGLGSSYAEKNWLTAG